MTATELIERLQQLPPDTEVFTELHVRYYLNCKHAYAVTGVRKNLALKAPHGDCYVMQDSWHRSNLQEIYCIV